MSSTKFSVEKIKWTWAKTVKSPGVYRDDEFIRTPTKEEALEAIGFMLNQPRGGNHYSITVFRDGEYLTYWRHSMPCLGGLVKYRDSHGEQHFMNPYFPRDISVAFPEGDITYIGYARASAKKMFEGAHNEFVFSQESPWVSAFGKKESIILKENYFILTDMNTDPTVFYSLLRLAGVAYGAYGAYATTSKRWTNPKAEILATKTTMADPRRLAGQKPIRISGGTWAEGYGYTRPYNESIFKTVLPTKFKDFGKLAGYPQAPYNNKYFLDEMRNKFDLDIKGAIPVSEKNEEILLKAWDYFKEQAKDLPDVA